MAEERLQRQLAAILSADMVGYSRLMGIDEARTLARLNALRRDLIDPAIAAHSGRIVKLMGDGALVEFASAVDAVTCAIQIQKQLRDHDAASTEGDPIRFRIGINVGDIIVEGDDILGDGVNIAARLEGMAEPGGISISEDAWRQMRGKVTANFYRYWRAQFEEYCSSRARLPAGTTTEGSVRARSGETDTRAARQTLDRRFAVYQHVGRPRAGIFLRRYQ